MHRPTTEELAAAADATVPDIVAPGLHVLFCGINPGLYTAAVGHHFARPGNRFWPALHAGGFTERRLAPEEDGRLPDYGLGITNVVDRATAAAAELAPAELVEGGRRLRAKVERLAPRYLAVLGVGAYRTAFDAPGAAVGLQPAHVGTTRLWVLPNPSGLNAHYPPRRLAECFRALHNMAFSPDHEA